MTQLAVVRPPGPPPSKAQLKLYERGLLNVHMQEMTRDGDGGDCCCSSRTSWSWPEVPPIEAQNLYTDQEWNTFGRGLSDLWNKWNPKYPPDYKTNLWLLRENERLHPVGLEWVVDTLSNGLGFSQRAEFILTWLLYERPKYELDHADARRVANQPAPPNLKFAWYLLAAGGPSGQVAQGVSPSSPAGPISQVMVEDTNSPLSVDRPAPPSHSQLSLYRHGIFSMHYLECESSGPNGDKLTGFPNSLPDELRSLYTQQEWSRFIGELTSVHHAQIQVVAAIKKENGRKAKTKEGVEWKIDTLGNPWEFILTWIPVLRQQYERAHPTLRRVSEEPPPRSLKHRWAAPPPAGPIVAPLVPINCLPSFSSASAPTHPPPSAPTSQMMDGNQHVSSPDHLNVYRNGILSIRYRTGEIDANTGAIYYGFPFRVPAEAETLYTTPEWDQLTRAADKVVTNQTHVQAVMDGFHTMIKDENSRKVKMGLKWMIDTEESSSPVKWEFILTWIPIIRQQYERDHPNARRVSEEPPPRNLKRLSSWTSPPGILPSMAISPIIPSNVPMASFASISTTTSSYPPPISSSTTSAPEYPPILHAAPPPAYDQFQVINTQELTAAPASTSLSPTQTVYMYVNKSVIDENKSTVAALPVNEDKNQSLVNSIPMTHNVILNSGSPLKGDPSASIPTAIQFCNYCGSRREPGSGTFCAFCGQHVTTRF